MRQKGEVDMKSKITALLLSIFLGSILIAVDKLPTKDGQPLTK